MHDPGPEISVVLPAWNEASTIGWILQRVRAVLPDSTEIIVVDDRFDRRDGAVRAVADRNGSIVPSCGR